MNVEWEKLTLDEFEYYRNIGVCLLAVGCVEVHGPHLPLGTDIFRAHGVAVRAAQREPAIVAPRTAMGFAHVSCGLAGAINMPAPMLIQFWENFCNEISRNGFKKILIINAHGGNGALLDAFCSDSISRRRDYTVYLDKNVLPMEIIKEVAEGTPWGHACAPETSTALEIFPDLVKMDRLPDKVYKPSPGVGIDGVRTPVDWCTTWPENYVGDARLATAEKGKKLVDWQVERIAKIIAAIKEDERTPQLLQQYFDRWEKGGAIPEFP